MHNYKELKVWEKAINLSEKIYLFSSHLPIDEAFNLKSQIKRSAVSIPSNIAEGAGRGTEKDFVRFLNIANASSFELETQLIIINKIFKIEINELIININ